MSKSDTNANATILLLDDTDTIIRKFKRAVTDSESEVRICGRKTGNQQFNGYLQCRNRKDL